MMGQPADGLALFQNFQDHVLGGMLYDLADGIISMDSMHNAEYAKATQEQYDKDNSGLLGSPGMCHLCRHFILEGIC
jgi:hypothetical protein